MIKTCLDDRKIDKEQQFDFLINETQIKRVLQNNIDFLTAHNKNYTKDQYQKIIELQAIIKNIK